MDINKSIEILKNNKSIGIDVDHKFYVLFDAKNETEIKKYNAYINNFELVLETANRLESYVRELNPLVYDIIEFSEKPIVLKLSGAKNISELAMQANQAINIRVVREGDLQQLLRKYRLPLILCLVNDEEKTDFDKLNIIDEKIQDAFLDASIIKLEANGTVEIIKK